MRRIALVPILVVAALSLLVLAHSHRAAAVTNNNNLIDDMTFDDTTTMSAAQIDSWLNTYFPSSCISPNSGFTASDPIGYSPNYPFVDGKYQYGGPVSAGRVIYDAAKAHGLNPQVLITKLQNEEQLVDGSAGCSSTWRYASAVGYACTDSDTFSHNYSYTGADPFTDSSALATPIYYRNGTAVNSITGSCVNHNVYAGFSEQVVHAAWALSIWRHKSEGLTGWAAVGGNWNHCDDNNTCPASMNIPASWGCYSGLMTQGTLKRCPADSKGVFYDGYATIDGRTLHMDDGATAALYVYTPHIQSFDNIFNGYFGSQFANDSFTPHPNGSLVANGSNVYLISNDKRSLISNFEVFQSYGYSQSRLKTATTGDMNLTAGSPINSFAPGTVFQANGDNNVYVMNYESGVLVKQHISYYAFNNLGYVWNDILRVQSWQMPAATASSILVNYQHPSGTLVLDKSTGKVYLTDQNSKHWVVNLLAFNTNYYDWSKVKAATTLDLGLANGPDISLGQGAMLNSGGNIYLVDYDGSGIMKRNVGPWECFSNRWHYTLDDSFSVDPSALPSRTGSYATC